VDSLRHVPLPPANLSDLSRSELEALLIELCGELAALKQTLGEQREEIARLKGLKGRPSIKPSGMENATNPPKSVKKEKRRFRGKVTARVIVADQVVKAAVPEGSRFNGCEPFLVQDPRLRRGMPGDFGHGHVLPAGTLGDPSHRVLARPMGRRSRRRCRKGLGREERTNGHFGPQLRRFVLMQYHQGQSTLPRLATFLRSAGVAISKRQLQRLLTDKQEDFVAEAQDVLRAGLETSPCVSVDDTGARHKASNGFCTQIGND